MNNNTGRYLITLALGIVLCLTVTVLFAGLVVFGVTADAKGGIFGPILWIGLGLWKIALISIAVFIARTKGRRTGVWGVVELLSSFIGTLILLFLPYTHEKQAQLNAARSNRSNSRITIAATIILFILDCLGVKAMQEHRVAALYKKQQDERADLTRIIREETAAKDNERRDSIAAIDVQTENAIRVYNRLVMRIDSLNKSAADPQLTALLKNRAPGGVVDEAQFKKYRAEIQHEIQKQSGMDFDWRDKLRKKMLSESDREWQEKAHKQMMDELDLEAKLKRLNKTMNEQASRLGFDLVELARTNPNAQAIVTELGISIKKTSE